MDRITRISNERFGPGMVPVVALSHNEINILPDFLAHYRGICDAGFLIVDDRSTDGSRDYLMAQPDVTLFEPVPGAEFLKERAIWKSGLLDHYGAGKWCLSPDIDELFVWPGAPDRSLRQYINALEAEGAEAAIALMIDMYGDMALADHVHDRADGQSLTERFCYFDGPGPFPAGYTMRPIARKQMRDFPTPPVRFNGGARDRLFFLQTAEPTPVQRGMIESYLRLDRTVTPRGLDYYMRMFMRQRTRHLFQGALNATKVGVFRWQEGTLFNGHTMNRRLRMSESIAALLHFPLTRGRAGIEYIVNRGQHAGGSKYYKTLLDGDGLDASPLCEHSLRYDGPQSLSDLMRDIPRG
ncbi:glycosyltransferase family 2 protein [Thalassococcus sp. BH17M4-6]|uniref:glycosyltransferase family 2 protein n=1 Tax=Thalassococcus sp. BH17M4-6 TaxID=3413148 RepID=UPI003BE4A399